MADPVGEEAWFALVDEASRTAGDLEQRVGVLEIYKRATAAEPWSNKLWLAYCEWFWSLHTDCQNGDAGWLQEEQELGQQLFTLQEALDVWRNGSQATKYRLNDSHELWNQWISIELQQLSKLQTSEDVDAIKKLFLERLQVPHATWEETSQMFSTFMTKYDEPAWEKTMVEVTTLARSAKELYSKRESHELKLASLEGSGDQEALIAAWKQYLDWEVAQQFIKKRKRGQNDSPVILSVALYERALCSSSLGFDPETWEDYITFLSSPNRQGPEDLLPPTLSVAHRATIHCPWSGALWSRCLLCAEAANLPFSEMEQIKHAATDIGDLDRDGMGGVVEFYVAWSTFLKRRATSSNATDEDRDIAEMGLPTALESVEEWSQRRHGQEDWKGDPMFRVEQVVIEYKTQQGCFEDARRIWNHLVPKRGNSYEFWQQYYLWEMTVRVPTAAPTHATSVLDIAVHWQGMDWPEKMMEIYIRHCQNYEEVGAVLKAMDSVRILSKGVAKRRANEAAAAAAMYAQVQPEAVAEEVVQESPSGASKRKRESGLGDVDETASKKTKKGPTAEEQRNAKLESQKRDRENTSILVTNLPPEVTQTKVRQYFKDYGHLNSLALRTESDTSTTALLEFRSPGDVQSALLRDGKYFVDRQISVTPATGLTVYVCNFPPTADENYLKKLFKECGQIFSIRWPSLKFNTTRRFCYISFRTPEGAAAATKLDGKLLEGRYTLVAKYSDPGAKKQREGAMAEGREVHVTGIDFEITEDDLREVFGKYGTIERVNLLRKDTGESKGAAFVSFERKKDATAALELDKTKLKAHVLTVEMSLGKNYKPNVSSKGAPMSPAADIDGNVAMTGSPAVEGLQNTHKKNAPNPADRVDRTVTLMGVPDIVNDARIHAVAEPYGELARVTLRPDHQGAILEYANVAAAGKAALGLEGHEIIPGRKLRTGGMKDLFAQEGEQKVERILIGKEKKKAPATFMQPSAPVRRPIAGGRGGLGTQKRGLGYVAPKKPKPKTEEANGEQNGDKNKPKSNADFKAIFLSGGEE